MKLKLQYSHEAVGRPILAELIAKTGLLVNILEARVTPSQGEMVVDIPIQGSVLEEAVEYLRRAGVNVTELYSLIELDRSRCISCGACVSTCPAKAIRLNDRLEVEFDEKRCVGCRICVQACPFKAIRIV